MTTSDPQDAGARPSGPAAHPHRPGQGPRRHAEHLQGADRPRHRGAAARRRGGRPRARPRGLPPADRAHRRRTPTPRPTASSRWSSVATGRSCGPPRSRGGAGPRCSGSTSATSGFLAEAESDDVEDVIDAIVARRWTSEDRLTLDVRAYLDGELVDPDLRAQRGQRGEGRPRADARGRRRDRQPAALPVGLRRGGAGHADRLHGVQLQRGWADRLAGASRRC